MKPKPKTKNKSKVKSKLKVERKNLSHEYIIKLVTSVSKLINTTEDLENFLDKLRTQLNNRNNIYYEQLLFTESDWMEGCQNWEMWDYKCSATNAEHKKLHYKKFVDTIYAEMRDCYFEKSDELFEEIRFGNWS